MHLSQEMAGPSRGEWVADGGRMASLVGAKALISLLRTRLVNEDVVQREEKDSWGNAIVALKLLCCDG